MKFPIDIIWLDNARKVIRIEHSLDPCPSDTIAGVFKQI
jgi:uncharacterized membrane protein (UPF0127 family)